MNRPDLTISIVNWNGKDYLLDFLASIFKYTKDIEFEVIVVDNGSSDASVVEMERNFPQVTILKNQKNTGYARAHNQALKRSHGRYIVFLNLDMLLVENSFQKMAKYMDENPKVDIMTTMLLYGDKKTVQPNVKRHPTLISQVLVLLKLHVFFKNSPVMRDYLNRGFDYLKEQPAEQIMGACVFARREIMEKVSGWGNEYPFWFEDLDLCKKVGRAGGTIMYAPVTKILHFESKSAARQLSLAKQKKFNRGLLLYFLKYHGFWPSLLLHFLHPVSLALAWLVQLLKFKPRSQAKIST